MTTNRVPYRISLRVLGRILNGDKARMVTVCEIADGFLLHYFAHGDLDRVTSRAIHSAEVLDLDDMLQKQRGKPVQSESFKDLQRVFGSRQQDALRFQKSHPLCPMGYEEYFRSLGQSLDGRDVRAVLISELEQYFQVEYTVDRADFVLREGQRLALPGRRQESHTAAQIAEVVRKARAHAGDQVRRSGQHLSFNPMDVVSYLDAAAVLESYDQHREAEDLYHKLLDLAPQHPDVPYQLALLAWRRDDSRTALKYVQRSLRLDGRSSRSLHLLARIQMQRGHFKEAAQALEQAVARDADNPMYRFHLSQVYQRMGRHDEAEAILRTEGERPIEDAVWAEGASAPSDAPRLPEEDGAALLEPAPDAASPFAIPIAVSTIPAAPTFPAVPLSSRVPHSEGTTASDQLPTGPLEPQAQPAHPLGIGSMSPFSMDAPAWDTEAAPPPPGPAADGESAAASDTPLPAPSPVGGSPDALPVLGISIANEWTTQALPTLDVPADGAAAAAALPLAGVSLGEDAPAPLQPLARPEPVSDAPSGLAAAAEQANAATSDEAVQLAAAIMRAEELVRAEPHRADLHRKLGFLLAKQGRSEEAAAEFRRAVECGRRRMAS